MSGSLLSLITTVLPVVTALIMSAQMEEYNLVIVYLLTASAFTVIFPLVLALLGWARLDKGMRFFAVLLCLVLLSETTAFLLGGYFKVNNLFIYDIFTAVEYVFFILVFSSWHGKNILRTSMLVSIPVFLLVWIAAKMPVGLSGGFDSVFLSVESVVFVFISVVTLAKEMRDSEVLLVDNPRFWISSGVLVYFAGNLFVFALIEQLLEPSIPRNHTAWMIHTTLNVTKNVLFSIGFLATGGPKERFVKIWRTLRKKKAATS
jgi:hypothetical protein